MKLILNPNYIKHMNVFRKLNPNSLKILIDQRNVPKIRRRRKRPKLRK